MEFRTLLQSLKNLGTHIFQGKILNGIYAGLTIIFFGLIAVALSSSLSFLLGMFNSVLFVSDDDARSEVPAFNIPVFESIASRFGILIPENPKAPPEP